ncbi:cof protein [Vibrio sp. JCM 19236]|nr:cof protein [Vibrio sp. JCM 19236]
MIEPLVKAARDLPMVNINFYNKNKWFISRETDWVKNNRSQIPLEYEVMNLIEPPTEEILKVYFTALEGGEDCLLELEQTLLSRFGDKLSICFSSPQCLEVMDLGINKLSGLKILSKALGIDLNHCTAFGDGMNDIEMLSGVGKGLFMGMTAPRPRQVLPKIEVIGDADDDAVAHYIEEHLL